MIKIALVVGGVIIGYVLRSFKDFLQFGNKPQEGDVIVELPHSGTTDSANTDKEENDSFNLSALTPLMDKYGIDINNVDALSLLVSKIDTVEYKNLLQKLHSANSANEMISMLNNYSYKAYDYSRNTKNPAGPFVSGKRVSHFLEYFKIKIPNLNTLDEKVDALLTYAFTNSFTSLKSQLGDLFQNLIKAHDNNEDTTPYFNDIKKEIKMYIDFLS